MHLYEKLDSMVGFNRFRKCIVVGLIFVMVGIFPKPSNAAAPTAMREFIMSCTYGVLAGTLVGAASLAFTDQPGENLNRVARGASLGLYAGILLGVYVVYIVPKQLESQQLDPMGLPPEEGAMNKFFVYPILSANNPTQIDGVAAGVNLLSF